MGASLGAGGSTGGKRRRRRQNRTVMNEINMTPFIDVMLVLLIIFMVAAPLMTVGVPIDLPESRAKAMEGQTKPITVSVDAAGKVFVQDTEVPVDQVVEKVTSLSKAGADERIFIRGDRTTNYGTVMRVMGRLSQAGFKKIGLVTLEETASR
jgi:biopolymer transport protein TolR